MCIKTILKDNQDNQAVISNEEDLLELENLEKNLKDLRDRLNEKTGFIKKCQKNLSLKNIKRSHTKSEEETLYDMESSMLNEYFHLIAGILHVSIEIIKTTKLLSHFKDKLF